MKKNSVLKVINPILGVLVINQILTGLFSEMLPHDVFEVLHEGGGIVFAIVAALHIVLNWNWVKTNFFRKTMTGNA